MEDLVLRVKKEEEHKSKYNFERFIRITILRAKSISTTKNACIRGESFSLTINGCYDEDKQVLIFHKITEVFWGYNEHNI